MTGRRKKEKERGVDYRHLKKKKDRSPQWKQKIPTERKRIRLACKGGEKMRRSQREAKEREASGKRRKSDSEKRKQKRAS